MLVAWPFSIEEKKNRLVCIARTHEFRWLEYYNKLSAVDLLPRVEPVDKTWRDLIVWFDMIH
jgi:hypothetical protein